MKKLLIGTLTACMLTSTAAYADAIADRKQAMKNVGMAMGTLVKMVKGQTDYDPAVAALAFSAMNSAAIGFDSLFPAGTETGGETTASPKIWSDMAGFKAAMDKYKADTLAAVAAKPADLNAFKGVFGKVAGNCKSCHEGYRISK